MLTLLLEPTNCKFSKSFFWSFRASLALFGFTFFKSLLAYYTSTMNGLPFEIEPTDPKLSGISV